jgi:DNA polymerase II small subunit/DNA polymerase delta subunit B
MISLADRLAEKKPNFSSHQWEAECAYLYDEIKNYDDLKRLLTETAERDEQFEKKQRGEHHRIAGYWQKVGEDANKHIIIMMHIIPDVTDLLSHEQREELIKIVETKKGDSRMCYIGGSTSYADEADDTTVEQAANIAREYLRSEEYAEKV